MRPRSLGPKENYRLSIASSPLTIEAIEERIAPLREQLASHPVYAAMQSIEDVRLFMQSHVYAVWDFMSLLKALQRGLTSVDVPWVPSKFPASRRFVNEIVLGEESDEFRGEPLSHFEIYLRAMDDVSADASVMRGVLKALASGSTWNQAMQPAPQTARIFVGETFRVIEEGSLAAQAAAFTFGREDVIPDLFRGFIRELNQELTGTLNTFIWYLERHIEVDGEDHGPLSLRMVADLCGDDPALWEEAARAAEAAMRARIALWDGILAEVKARR
ncbi:DUF3050 domain-containing protein [Granulicella cerasi]|uniref:DUF3050 domain-containing protein n=1 Tax=Granulicella cerasi TaxID=741063 RepID=A0ABW1ZB18_9BACT|nr:DUF3050 domain-containing protein [Granulicella cerasi]